ncbi:heterokaryon incompatibility protein-domain-containing protein [Bisporella sp. PMI_857]|nr:heterokaryon incompatibility protein-domain-containing protein [Bisporella sp. PMI_857]
MFNPFNLLGMCERRNINQRFWETHNKGRGNGEDEAKCLGEVEKRDMSVRLINFGNESSCSTANLRAAIRTLHLKWCIMPCLNAIVAARLSMYEVASITESSGNVRRFVVGTLTSSLPDFHNIISNIYLQKECTDLKLTDKMCNEFYYIFKRDIAVQVKSSLRQNRPGHKPPPPSLIHHMDKPQLIMTALFIMSSNASLLLNIIMENGLQSSGTIPSPSKLFPNLVIGKKSSYIPPLFRWKKLEKLPTAGRIPEDEVINFMAIFTLVGGCISLFIDWLLDTPKRSYLVVTYAVLNLAQAGIQALFDKGDFIDIGPRGYLTVIVALLQFRLPLPGYGITKPVSSFYRYWAVSYILAFAHPMAEQLRGMMTDDDSYLLLEEMALKAYLWFAPGISYRLLLFVWHLTWQSLKYYFLYGVIPGLILLWAILRFSPMSERFFEIFGTSFFPPHTIFMVFHEILTYGFHGWEIGISERLEQNSLPSYQYEKLASSKSIRLLKIKRKRLFSRPVCQIIHVDLHEAPPYEALSYTWGGQVPKLPLNVNGSQLLITRNVHDFLFHQRSLLGPRLFWIDSICINQNDLDEKSVQLELMTDIYRQASRVLVWLGPPIDVLQARSLRQAITRWFNRTLDAQGVEEGFNAMRNCLEHPYFERGWIIQEITVARTVHVLYNGTCLSLDALVHASSEIRRDFRSQLQFDRGRFPARRYAEQILLGSKWNDTLPKHFHEVEILRAIRSAVESKKDLPLLSLLWYTHSFQCTNARDKIFALYGIASDAKTFPYRLKYNDTVEEVYTKVSAILLQSEHWFFALTTAGRGYISERGSPPNTIKNHLPSWVPDYSHDDYWGIRVSQSTVLSQDNRSKPVIIEQQRLLKLQAEQFDSISALCSEIFAPPGPVFTYYLSEALAHHTKDPLLHWLVSSRAFLDELIPHSQISAESLDQRLWETILADEDPNTRNPFSEMKIPHSPLSTAARKFAEYHGLFGHDASLTSSPQQVLGVSTTTEEDRGTLQYLRTRVAFNALGKRLCVTSEGSLGLVPPLSKVEDVFVHVDGGDMPLLLRLRSGKTRVAKLIGSAYVHGCDDVNQRRKLAEWTLQ